MPNQSNFTPEQITEILELFFENMAHRQYIGARYVPIFGRKDETSIIWDNTAPYEPLTIVLHEGNSYTSRQYVPAGIEITNNLYWAETGNYNAQVEQYRQEVLNLDDDIQELKDTVSPYTSENTVANAITAIETNITELQGAVSPYTSENTVAEAIADVTDTIYQKYMVCVDQYGAIGDGVTDSTAAIQQCIDENPNAIVFFRKGVYLISDEIQLYGRNGAQVIELGGSIIQPSESMEYCFIFDKDKPATGAFQNATPIIQNGLLNCISLANGVMVNDINCDVRQVTIRDPKSWGIYLNNVASSGVSSGNCIIEGCHIENGRPYTNWYTKSAIICCSMDNKIVDTNTFRFGYAINLHAMGQTVSNCHIFAGIFNSITPAVFKTAAIYISSDATQLDPLVLLNNYIDNCFYYIHGAYNSNRFTQTVVINGGFFLWSNDYGFQLTESYILNPELPLLINIDGLVIEENTALNNLVIYTPIFRDYVGGAINNQVRCECSIAKTRSQITSLTEYMGQYQIDRNESVFLATSSTTGANTYIKVGCLARPMVENSIAPVEISFNRGNVTGNNRMVIGFNAANDSLILDSGFIGTRSGIKIAVSKRPETVKHIGSSDIGIYPIYLGGIANSGVIYGSLTITPKTNAIAAFAFPQLMQTQIYTLDPEDYNIY